MTLLTTLTLLATVATAAPRPVTERIDKARERTRACQQQLGLERSPVSNRPVLGIRYRRWVLALWQTRQEAFCGALQHVRELTAPHPRELAAAKAWANTSGARCVSAHEGAVTSNTGNGYYGRWQADTSFQAAYAPEYVRRWGTANNWPRWAQDVMAYRGWQARGWQPWPTTSIICGVR